MLKKFSNTATTGYILRENKKNHKWLKLKNFVGLPREYLGSIPVSDLHLVTLRKSVWFFPEQVWSFESRIDKFCRGWKNIFSSTQTCPKIFGGGDFNSIERIFWPKIVSITQKKVFDSFRTATRSARTGAKSAGTTIACLKGCE